MALLKLSISSIDMTTAWGLPPKDGRQRSRDALCLRVTPHDRDYLQLKTGEIFCNGSNSAVLTANRRRICASLVIQQADSDHDSSDNKLRYVSAAGRDGVSHETAIRFYWYLSPDDFRGLVSNIRCGMLPTQANVALQYEIVESGSSLRFNLEPDGSGIRWDNDNPAARKLGLNIEHVSLQFRLSNEDAERESREASLIREIGDHLTRMHRATQRIGNIFIGGLAVLMIVAFLRY